MFESVPIDHWTQVAAPLVALVVSYVLFYEGLIHKIDDWAFLRSLLPFVDDEAREAGFYTQYTIRERELVGVLKMSRAEALELFEEKGFLDAPLAAHKEDWQGRREVASLGYYGRHGDEILAMNKLPRFLYMAFVVSKQLHVTLFEDENGDVVVTAHYEWSPYNVFKAFEHFRGEDYNVEKGVHMTGFKLRNVKRFEVADGTDTSNPNADYSPALF